MTTEVEDFIREIDSTIEGLNTGNRELDLQMIEFLIALDERVANLLKAQSDRVDRKLFDELHDRAKELSFENRDLGSALAEREARITELLEKEDSLRRQVEEREADIRDAVSEGESWKGAFLHVREQILTMAKEQGAGHARIREHLQSAQSVLDTEDEADGEDLGVELEWTPRAEALDLDEDGNEAERDDDLAEADDLPEDDLWNDEEYRELLAGEGDLEPSSGQPATAQA